MKITYESKQFRQKTLDLIEQCNQIIREWRQQGYSLTVRQLYYQLVAANIVPNNLRSYKRVASVVSDARRAGLISWYAIEDRTRRTRGFYHYENPYELIRDNVNDYRINHWEGQENSVMVWVEKDALIDIVARACNRWDVRFMSTRGYVSDSAAWRHGYSMSNSKKNILIHLADHDPSGKDMTGDLWNRLGLFSDHKFDLVDRIALNMDQIAAHQPPPNPAKLTDSRAAAYISQYGPDSWELDALRPDVIDRTIDEAIRKYVDVDLFEERREVQEEGQELLQKVADQWITVIAGLEGND